MQNTVEPFIGHWPPLLQAAVILAAAALLGLTMHAVLYRAVGALGRRVHGLLVFDGALLRHSCAPTRLLFPLVGALLALPLAAYALPPEIREGLEDTLYIGIVVAVAWFLVRLARVLDEVIARRFDIGAEDNLLARKVRTQTGLLRRVAIVAIGLLALGAIFLRFETFRTLGTGILASAGIVGIVVGVAAQRPIGNLLAGIQIATTQPIRVDDVVVVKGDWGRIEEITLTYVVVRIWDLRRLVLPISHFVEKPFENWTRTSTEILGTVFLRVDYTVPVPELRAELERIVRESEHWDGKVCRLHVTDMTERTLELRALVSARDAGRSWELRCEVRERMIDWVQRRFPEALPKLRARWRSPDEERPEYAAADSHPLRGVPAE